MVTPEPYYVNIFKNFPRIPSENWNTGFVKLKFTSIKTSLCVCVFMPFNINIIIFHNVLIMVLFSSAIFSYSHHKELYLIQQSGFLFNFRSSIKCKTSWNLCSDGLLDDRFLVPTCNIHVRVCYMYLFWFFMVKYICWKKWPHFGNILIVDKVCKQIIAHISLPCYHQW